LSLSHDIVVKQLGGAIEVESAPGTTRFIIRLPRADPGAHLKTRSAAEPRSALRACGLKAAAGSAGVALRRVAAPVTDRGRPKRAQTLQTFEFTSR
jgi:hypothetical protein